MKLGFWSDIGKPMALGGVLAKSIVDFLFRDDFTTTEAAPITSPRTAEPGPGTAIRIDSENKLSIANGKLTFTPHSVPAFGDPGYWENIGETRAIGLAVVAQFNASVSGDFQIGFSSRQNSHMNFGSYFYWNDTVDSIDVRGPGINITILSSLLSILTNYEIAVILRSAGAFYVIKGGIYADWTLVYVAAVQTTTPVYASEITDDATYTSEYIRKALLGSLWADDYALATQRLDGVRSAGNAFMHESDFIGEFEQTTVPTAGFTSFVFRRQDANNYWEVIVEPNQDISLREVIDSTPTARGTSAGVVNNGDRIVVIADDTTINVYNDDVLEIEYASASRFKSETDGRLLALGVDAVVSDIITWPRKLTGAAKKAIEDAAA